MWRAVAVALCALSCLVPAEAADVSAKSLVVYVSQTRAVKTECFPKALRSILQDLRKEFGKPIVVTSGHRSGRRASRGSQHRTCKAADLRIPGVSASSIARFARAHPLAGGVGTYCGSRTGLVHVDVGPRRDWHHCGRSKKRRRK